MFRKKRPVTFGDFATGAIRQGVLDGGAERASADHLMATDGFIATYRDVGIDWKGIWSDANRRRDRIPPFGVRPYWVPMGPRGALHPLSSLAFWGAPDRLRIARDPSTEPTLLRLMAGDQMGMGIAHSETGDPDSRVSQAAAQAMRGAIRSPLA